MPGTFVFRPIEANLTHDTDWLGKMDPYCAYMMNNKRIKGQVCKSGGQHPIWSDSTTVPMEIDQPACVVELMDKDTFIDDSIGTFVIDLNEVRNYGQVSKWYPVFHKNKPAGQILFEAAFQPSGYVENVNVVQPVMKETVVHEVPKKALVEETVVREAAPTIVSTETVTQSSWLSKGGVAPIGTTNLDGGLYGKVVHMEPVSHVPNAHLGTGLAQEPLPRTELGGPLSGSLGGGVLGSRELTGSEFVSGTQYTTTTHNVTEQYKTSQQQNLTSGSQLYGNQLGGTQLGGTQLGGTQLGGTQLGGTQLGGNQLYGNQLGNQNLNLQSGNQLAGSNLPVNFNSTSISNAQLGGGAPLYQETANHPTSNPTTHSHKLFGKHGKPNEGNIIPGDLVGGHTQTNKNLGDQNPL